MSNIFKRTSGLRPGRSVFDLSHEVKTTCDMGQLVPIMCEDVIPGDVFTIGNQIVIRFAPLIAPIMHEVNCFVHYFFVPYRILWDEWEDFITGGDDGTEEPTLPTMMSVAPVAGGVLDYLGFPLGVIVPVGQRPVAFPLYAYNKIYNEFYRDPTLINEKNLTNTTILTRAWEKDYFTSALPWQQRGTPVALPISGITNAEFPLSSFAIDSGITANGFFDQTGATEGKLKLLDEDGANGAILMFNNNEVDFADAATFDVADLRLAFQVQKFLERNARVGPRYVEQLKGHYGVAPRDDRLQRPEYIGGSKSRIIVSEVLQTSSSDAVTPQGNLAGHGISADATYCGRYRAEEHGIIMGIMSIMPKPVYNGQGIDRQWLRKTRYDYYFPEFANLSEQAITRKELYVTTVEADNDIIFGYQGRYDEYRYRPSKATGLMRSDLSFWHLGRIFGSAPVLNESFINCVPRKDVFAVPTEPACIVSIGNLVKAIRPMPIMSTPGLIDHN